MRSCRLGSSFFFMLAISILQACTSGPTFAIGDVHSVAAAMKEVDVLLVSDHTLPNHLNFSSGGANGEERRFIDPTLQSLNGKLINRGLRTHILNVEDMVVDSDIQNKAVFDAAYEQYDQILKAAAQNGVTIASIHYDADRIPAQDYGKDGAYASAEEDGAEYGYIGGVQLILDERSSSSATLALADRIIHRDKILQQLNEVGFRIRPGYRDKVRFQNNMTLNIAGHSRGGAFLLEIAPQDQAVRLYGSPEKIVEALDIPMDSLADTLYAFRQGLH